MWKVVKKIGYSMSKRRERERVSFTSFLSSRARSFEVGLNSFKRRTHVGEVEGIEEVLVEEDDRRRKSNLHMSRTKGRAEKRK